MLRQLHVRIHNGMAYLAFETCDGLQTDQCMCVTRTVEVLYKFTDACLTRTEPTVAELIIKDKRVEYK